MNAPIDIAGVRLETERLILREWRFSDLDDLFAYASVPGTGEAAGWPHHESKEETLVILDGFIKNKKTFALVDKESGKVIGSLGLEKYAHEDEFSEFLSYRGREIGYVLSAEYWGKGLMPEAVEAVIDYCFDALDLDFLLCGHFLKNNRSMRVQEKCGFVRYRKLVFDTKLGTKEPGYLNLLVNPKKKLEFAFSHPETLLIGK